MTEAASVAKSVIGSSIKAGLLITELRITNHKNSTAKTGRTRPEHTAISAFDQK